MTNSLDHLIREAIKSNGGKLHFADYMQAALYTPGLGYYMQAQSPIGERGDFITAAEMSPVFANCLAKQCQQILAQLDQQNLLEFGAGNGTLAAQLLVALEKFESLPEHYFVIEVSAELKRKQQATLQQLCPHLMTRVVWLTRLPESFTGMIIANEVLDAMPVQCFHTEDHHVKERYVSEQDGQLCWQMDEISDPQLQHTIENVLADIEPLPDGYQSEINCFINPWLASIDNFLEQGVVLLIDYGFPRREYYHPDRHMGTLMCYHQHHSTTDPLQHPGQQDITAHVDFTSVAEAAVKLHFNIAGYTTQAYFLLACGIAEQQAATPHEQIKMNQAIKKLTMPHEMGELFKVIALSKNFEAPLLGFSWRDLTAKL